MKLYIVKIKGHQYKVKPGDIIEVDKLDEKKGKEIEIKEVLLSQTDKDINIGNPYIKGQSVKAKVLGHTKGDKIEILKYRKKNRYMKRTGHRQKLTKLEIL